MLLTIEEKLDGEDEQVKKKKRSVWMKPWIQSRLCTIAQKFISGTTLEI